MHDMFRLWCLGEEDLLSETAAYKLTDTGQGKQRVQQSPRTFKAMQVKCPVYRTSDGIAVLHTYIKERLARHLRRKWHGVAVVGH